MGFPEIKSNKVIDCIIYTTGGGGTHPIHGAYRAFDSYWCLSCWTLEGYRIGGTQPSDLDITMELTKIKLNDKVKEEREEVECPV
mgnify:CR=1 FL=1